MHYTANSQNEDIHLQVHIQSILLSTWFTTLLRMWNTCFYYHEFSLIVFLKDNVWKTGIQFRLHTAQQVLWPVVQNRHQQMHPLSCRQPIQLILLDQVLIIQTSEIHHRSNAGILREVDTSSNWEWQMHGVVLKTPQYNFLVFFSFTVPLMPCLWVRRHGMAHLQVADGGMVSVKEGSCEYIE